MKIISATIALLIIAIGVAIYSYVTRPHATSTPNIGLEVNRSQEN